MPTHEGPVLPHLTHTLRAEGDHTVYTRRIRFETRGLFKVIEPLIKRMPNPNARWAENSSSCRPRRRYRPVMTVVTSHFMARPGRGIRKRRYASGPSPLANMVTLLSDVAPDGSATMIQRGAQLFDESGPAKFESLPQDWILREGHRLGLFVSASDSTFFFPLHTDGDVTVKSGTWSVPFLRYERTPDLEGTFASPTTTSVQMTNVADDLIESRTVDASFPPAPTPRG